jgi:hypothetical protein
MAYDSGLVPNVLGHTSDEISFTDDFFSTTEEDCTFNLSSDKTCIASCSTFGAAYKSIGGSCISDGGYQWRTLGTTTPDGLEWKCVDETHFENYLFKATVWCMKAN